MPCLLNNSSLTIFLLYIFPINQQNHYEYKGSGRAIYNRDTENKQNEMKILKRNTLSRIQELCKIFILVR